MSDELKNEILERKAAEIRGLIIFHDCLQYEIETGETESEYEKYLNKRIQFKNDLN